MKNLEHIGNQFQGIARDLQILLLLDFPRGCQRFPESHKDPQGKGKKDKKKAPLRVEGKPPKKEFFFSTPPLLVLLYVAPPWRPATES